VLNILFFESADGPRTDIGDIEHALATTPHLDLLGKPGEAYRPGEWRDPNTGAYCLVDLGESPVEHDSMHPSTSYPGWYEAPLSVHIPLAAPHWYCVEALRVVEGITAKLPQLRALDSEDTTKDEASEPGPFDWNRLRVLANWERLHLAQSASRQDLFRLERPASLAMWRYRRERARGLEQHPQLTWPEALVLLDLETGIARSAALWQEAGHALAVPPVELLVIPRSSDPGVLPCDELLTAGAGKPLSVAQAVEVQPSERVRNLSEKAKLMPKSRFRALNEGDWSD
jgi:hypothetical protein